MTEVVQAVEGKVYARSYVDELRELARQRTIEAGRYREALAEIEALADARLSGDSERWQRMAIIAASALAHRDSESEAVNRG